MQHSRSGNQVDMMYTFRLSTTHTARNIGVQTHDMTTAVLTTGQHCNFRQCVYCQSLQLAIHVCLSRNNTSRLKFSCVVTAYTAHCGYGRDGPRWLRQVRPVHKTSNDSSEYLYGFQPHGRTVSRSSLFLQWMCGKLGKLLAGQTVLVEYGCKIIQKVSQNYVLRTQ